MSIRIPLIGIGNQTIPRVTVNGTGIPLVQPVSSGVRSINTIQIADNRVWVTEPPQAIPITVPVTVNAGTPVVYMPGCVEVHKENTGKDPSRNKNLVNDDPQGTTTLCDAGMPNYYPVEYDYRELFWQTINTEPEKADEGVETQEQDPIEAPAPPPPPPAGGETAGEVECPPLNARRIGDLNQAGTEKIKEYKLTVDGLRCETIWEPVPVVEQYLPSVATVSTTATIATVATASALFAKPLADLLLKVVKPVIKKVVAKVKKIMGKTDPVLSRRERMLAQRDRNRAVMELRKALKK